MPLTTSQPFKGGGSRDAVGTLNAMLAETKRTAGLPPSSDTYLPEEHWPGVVDDEGYDDYEDERYWIRIVYAANDDGDGTTALTLTEHPDTHVEYKRVTATNLSEFLGGTHKLAAGTAVHVHKLWDRSSPEPVERYFFAAAAAAAVNLFLIDDATVGATTGNAITAINEETEVPTWSEDSTPILHPGIGTLKVDDMVLAVSLVGHWIAVTTYARLKDDS